MITIDSHVEGLAELDRFLSTLPDELQRKMLVSSLRQATKPIIAQAQSNIERLFGNSARYTGVLAAGVVAAKQRDTGLAARVNIKTKKPKGSKTNEVINGVRKPYGRDPFYGRFLEKGTSKMPARPWLQPAAMAKQDEAGRALNADLQKRMAKWCKDNGVKYVPGGV
jgi:HK97 gp10 family phage protein